MHSLVGNILVKRPGVLRITTGHNSVWKLSSRPYRVLAIESSCDDSSVALIEYDRARDHATVLSSEKSTLDSAPVGGIVPTQAFQHHQTNLPLLVDKLNIHQSGNRPDLIAVTRGPGMAGSLSVGLNIAKGLSMGLNVPLLGINHMLGHLLIPRMNQLEEINFPLVSLLVSGGHTMLVYSESVLKHEIICNSIDIAVGDSLDKCGREIGLRGIMIGKEIEKFANEYELTKERINPRIVNFPNPLTLHNKGKNGFSFAPFITALKDQLIKQKIVPPYDSIFQRQLSWEIQEAIFTHIITKINHVLENNTLDKFRDVKNFICSGGVGSNKRLRYRLESELNFKHFHYPPVDLCTDNAVMIGWTAIELLKYFNAKEKMNIKNDINIIPLRKWPLSDIVSISKWIKTDQEQ